MESYSVRFTIAILVVPPSVCIAMQPPQKHKTEITISARFEEMEFLGAYIRELKLSLTTRDFRRRQTTITNRLTTYDTTDGVGRELGVEIRHSHLPHGYEQLTHSDEIFTESHFSDKHTHL
ncbi:MAG: hypothetical protein K6T61_16560 [Bryobacteraceae bacterium]|nr:hypothetical protein [Bryobacteraceae bacterium]